MDAAVVRSMSKWPNVPAVDGWLALDRRGNWRIKGERISNAALREFIARNYEADAEGRWYFQNGPQRVYVSLAYAPFVAHHEGEALFDHCGARIEPKQVFLDDEGSIVIAGGRSIALLDDRDLERYGERAERLPRIAAAELERRYGFVREPRP
jgi:Protein of unknown function (DUF2946)